MLLLAALALAKIALSVPWLVPFGSQRRLFWLPHSRSRNTTCTLHRPKMPRRPDAWRSLARLSVLLFSRDCRCRGELACPYLGCTDLPANLWSRPLWHDTRSRPRSFFDRWTRSAKVRYACCVSGNINRTGAAITAISQAAWVNTCLTSKQQTYADQPTDAQLYVLHQ